MSDNNPYTMFQQTPAQAPQGTIGFQNPLQAIVMGDQMGTTMANNQNIQAANQMSLQAVQQQRQVQQQQLAQQQQKQQRIIELSRKIASGYYPERGSDMAELSQLANPESFKQMNEASKQMTLEQHQKLLTSAGTVISLLYSGDVKAANDFLNKEAQAAQLGGDQETMRSVMAAQQVIANTKNPKLAAQQLEYALSGIDGSKDMIDTIGKTQLRPSEIAKTQSETTKNQSEFNLNAEKINSERAGQIKNIAEAGKFNREPVGANGAGTQTGPGSVAEIDSNINQIDNVLNKFHEFASKGVQLPSGMGGAGATLDDWLNANGELAQWRGSAQQALITPILDKLKALRPASDIDVKTITDAVGNIKSNPIMAMNALAKEKQLLQFYKDSAEAQRNYPADAKKGESLQKYLDRVVPMPKFNSTPYAAKNSGIIPGLDKWQYTLNGQPITSASSGFAETSVPLPPNMRPSGTAKK